MLCIDILKFTNTLEWAWDYLFWKGIMLFLIPKWVFVPPPTQARYLSLSDWASVHSYYTKLTPHFTDVCMSHLWLLRITMRQIQCISLGEYACRSCTIVLSSVGRICDKTCPTGTFFQPKTHNGAYNQKTPDYSRVLKVARGGIEPPTQGFSVLCSTDWATKPFTLYESGLN